VSDTRSRAELSGAWHDLVWISRRVDNHAVVVQVGGEVDLVSAPVVDGQLRAAEALVMPPSPVVLDLTTTAFFGSSGLALLVKHASRCAELGSRLRVVADQAAVLRPIAVTGIGQLVDVVPTIDQALEHLR